MHSKDLSLVRIRVCFLLLDFTNFSPQLSACIHATDALLYPLHWYDSDKCSPLALYVIKIIVSGSTSFVLSCHPV